MWVMLSHSKEGLAHNNTETTRADLQKDPAEVAEMFDAVAPRYDLTNDVISMGLVLLWRQATKTALNAGPGQRILDVAAGTGTSAAAIEKTGASVVALDLSPGMVKVGRQRHPEVEFVLGSATALPFDDDSFDAVTICYGLRNIDDVSKALSEFYRVTKPGGRLLICEFSTPAAPLRPIHNFYLEKVAPTLGRLTSPAGAAYDYLTESIEDWYTQEELGAQMWEAGWRGVQYRNLSFGAVALHRGFKP